MRKLLLLIAVLMTIGGCMSMPLSSQDISKAGKDIAIVDAWATAEIGAAIGSQSAMRGVTLVVANPTADKVAVEASCKFKNGALFGKTEADVEANSKRKIMVVGFNQCPEGACESERLTCSVRRR